MLQAFRTFWRSSRNLRWSVMVGLSLLLSIALVLMFLLAQATGNREIYERNFERLLVINLVVAVMLFAVISWMAWRVLSRFRRGKFGSRLLLKLAAAFVLVASVPGALIYLVSYQFVTRSIESWFDVRVETALDAGLNLGRNLLDQYARDTGIKTESAAEQLVIVPSFNLAQELERLRLQQHTDHMVLWSPQGERIAGASASQLTEPQLPPSADVLEQLKTELVVTVMEGLDEEADGSTADPVRPEQTTRASGARVVSYTVVRPSHFVLQSDVWVLQVVQVIPAELLANALTVQEANREYQERALARAGMSRMFIGTLTLTLILAIFGAVLLAAMLATQLARPLLMLAEGVRQVAAGDLRPKSIYKGNDELGGLTQSFAAMTQQLADARQALTNSVAELDASRSELQTILDNLSTGVMLLTADGTVLSANPAASRILGVDAAQLLGYRLEDIPDLHQVGQTVQQQFEGLIEHEQPQPADTVDVPGSEPASEVDERWASKTTHEYWQHTLELNPASHEGLQHDVISLVLRGALLPDAAISNVRLLVFEDVSALISAQRTQAWAEVARRLAHEIKNPLTPIQLSAERLEMKLMDCLEPREQAVLAKSVRTIVDQVDAMKRLVNEFRDYARLPAAHLEPTDLNALVTDILHLYGAENTPVPIEAELDPDCHLIMADAQQLRQVIHNLLQNAQDAQEQAGHTGQPVLIQTQWRPATQRVRLSVLDHGIGFPESILQRAFEPYVTTKSKGTGLGLAVVKKIADDHGARLAISNRQQEGEVAGAQVTLLFPAADSHPQM